MGTAPYDEGTVEFASGGDALRAYVVEPSGAGPRPAVIILHEVWGLTDHIKDVARRFADEGYTALAPDLYSREGTPAPRLEILRPLILSIPDDRIVQDLRAAMSYLGGVASARADRIGAVGFCSGGTSARLLACHEPALAVCVEFYGWFRYPELTRAKPRQPLDYIAGLACPYLGFFAGDDERISVDDVERFGELLARHDKTFQVHLYPGVPRGFFNDTQPSYRAQAAREAWEWTLTFLRRHLEREDRT